MLAALTWPDASALGLVVVLQFAPQLLLPLTGLAAERFDRRRFLMGMQSAMGVLSFALGLRTSAGIVRQWKVRVAALVFLNATDALVQLATEAAMAA